MRRLSLRGQWLGAALLLLLLLALGTGAAPVLAGLTRFWQAAFSALGQAGWLRRLQQGTSPEVAVRSLPAVASYAGLYLLVCLWLLRVLLPDAARWQLVLRLYAAALALIAGLLLLGKLGGDVAWLYRVARRLIDALISPLPVLLLALLRTPLLGPAEPTEPNN